MGWTGQEVMAATGAATAAGADPAGVATMVFDTVCTDSRRVPQRALFVALRGPHHDGHHYIVDALRQGALAAIVDHVPAGVDAARLLVVGETLRALGDVAAWTRRRWPLRVVGITGSNGKTTTKEMVAAIGMHARFGAQPTSVLKTTGNENNLVGLPLTLLRLTGSEALAVLEMGMNAPGEIARLAQIAAPDVGVITNIGPAHLQGVGGMAGVAAAKGELFAGMARDATIAVNMDDDRVVRVASDFPGRRIEFGRGREVQARATRDDGVAGLTFALEVAGRTATVRLQTAGMHNVSNALAAAAVAHGLGVDVKTIAAGLAATAPAAMRMQVIRLANGTTLINDAYNANPASVEAALRAVARLPGRSLAVLGEMRELGDQSVALHELIGRQAAECGIRVLVAVGPEAAHIAAAARAVASEGMAVHVCADAVAAAAVVRQVWRSGDAILVKGSRGSDTEEAVRRYGARMAEVVWLLEEAGGPR